MKNARWLFQIAVFVVCPAVLAYDGDPETRVEISVYDLIGKIHIHRPPDRPIGARLPQGYGEQVAARIKASETALKQCLSPVGMEPAANVRQEASALILIAPDGKGKVKVTIQAPGAADGLRECLQGVLAAVSYPPHPLKSDVKVSLPLHLSKEIR